MDRRGSLTILLPAKNEAAGIAATLEALPVQALRSTGWDVDVVVADGRSTDSTVAISEAWGARVIVQTGKGKGLGVRQAIPHLRGDFVVMLDADGTYDAAAIPSVVERLASGADVVLGSRFRGEIEPGAMSVTNRLGNRLLSSLASILFLRRVSDVCTGMWGFRTRKLAQLPLSADRYELEVDLFASSARARLRIEEVKIRYGARHGHSGLNSWKDGIAIGKALVRFRFARHRN